MFNEKSGLVLIWVRLLSQDDTKYTINDVPKISNLKEVVNELLEKK